MTATTPPRTSAKTSHSLTRSIAALPAELLVEVFSVCAASNALAPLTLLQVCHLWNAVVTTCPHIWQNIILDDSSPRAVVSSQKQASLWIARSAPLAFDIHLDVTSPDHLLSLLSPCLPHVARWREITLTGMREEQVTISDLEMDSLNHLIISIGPDDDEYLGIPTFVDYSPFRPREKALNLRMSALPSTSCLHFTTLYIAEHRLETHLSSKSILDFFSSCPNVAFLYFAGYIHTDEAYTPSSNIAHLPHLTSLTIKSTSLIRSLLSHINAPNLSELHLSALNVDIELPGSIVNEDGDSDDEAQDFSLSPSSDKATGMGLRKLISRCNPPIRVLRMNFSDMRTKDFRYAFKRLQSLEDFAIVASDLSDRVVEMFRDCLPALRRIELLNCHRFSGDAMVRVLGTRNFAPLEELVISECQGFTPEHAHILMKDMGSRFRDD